MQHSFHCTCMMSSLDELQCDALAHFHYVVLCACCELELVLDFVNGEVVYFFKLLVYFFLHLLVLQERN